MIGVDTTLFCALRTVRYNSSSTVFTAVAKAPAVEPDAALTTNSCLTELVEKLPLFIYGIKLIFIQTSYLSELDFVMCSHDSHVPIIPRHDL